jgi:hypothetical protein
MKYYIVESSHWPMNLEFKSEIELKEGQCFKIMSHSSLLKNYPTRFKVLSVSDTPTFSGPIVEITDVDYNVEPF